MICLKAWREISDLHMTNIRRGRRGRRPLQVSCSHWLKNDLSYKPFYLIHIQKVPKGKPFGTFYICVFYHKNNCISSVFDDNLKKFEGNIDYLLVREIFSKGLPFENMREEENRWINIIRFYTLFLLINPVRVSIWNIFIMGNSKIS